MPLDSLDTLDSMATRTAPTPMQPTQIARPFHHEGWVYEEKVDGWRMLAYKIAGTVKLVSRNGRDHTSRFPAIVAALRELDATALILDGEVAVYDARLVSRFEWLRHSSPPHLSTPPLFMVFDCLQGPGRQGPGIALPRRAHAQVAQGEATEVSRGRARLGDDTLTGPRGAVRLR